MKPYLSPEVEFIRFSKENILATSNTCPDAAGINKCFCVPYAENNETIGDCQSSCELGG